jgi:hypothetical protein
MGLDQWLLVYVAIGAFIGFFAGMLGMGGGGIQVPLTTMAFAAQGFPREHMLHVALGTAMATVIFTSLSSLRAHDHVHQTVVLFVTREFVEPRRDARDERFSRPRLRPRARILDRVFVLDRGRIDERKALGHLHVLGGSLKVRAWLLVVEVRDVDDQCVPVPSAAYDFSDFPGAASFIWSRKLPSGTSTVLMFAS